jgi:hypothetical protein
MPSYPYECPGCGIEFDIVKSFNEIDRIENCINCGNLLDSSCRRIGRVYFTGEKPFESYYCPGLGCVVNSAAQRNRLAKDRGLEEIGTENAETIHKHFDSFREEKRKDSWDELTKPIEVNANVGNNGTADKL